MENSIPVTLIEHRYEIPFAFTGTIDRLTFELEPEPQRTAQR